MYWEQDPTNFYQKIEIKLKRENGEVNGKIDVVITLCIGGNVNTSTIENYELFSVSYVSSHLIRALDLLDSKKIKLNFIKHNDFILLMLEAENFKHILFPMD
jgi:hypothetical protein